MPPKQKKPKTKKKKTKLVPPPTPKRRTRRRRFTSDGGITRISKTEYMSTVVSETVKAGTTVKRINPGYSGAIVYDQTGKYHATYKLHRFSIKIKGMGPATSTCVLYLCFDASTATKPATYESILHVVPSIACRAWTTVSLRASSQLLNRYNQFMSHQKTEKDQSDPFRIYVASTGSSADDDVSFILEMTYDASFYNPEPPAP